MRMVRVTLIVAAILIVGCSEQNNAPKKVQGDSQKPKTVVVNKGMSKKKEKKLEQRVAELEDKVKGKSDEQTTQKTSSAEDLALAAARDYYAAAATGDYHYTYNALSSYSQSQFSEDEWVADNAALGSDAADYSIDSVTMVDDSTAEVHLTIIYPDGSSS